MSRQTMRWGPEVHEDILIALFQHVNLASGDWAVLMDALRDKGYTFTENALRYALPFRRWAHPFIIVSSPACVSSELDSLLFYCPVASCAPLVSRSDHSLNPTLSPVLSSFILSLFPFIFFNNWGRFHSLSFSIFKLPLSTSLPLVSLNCAAPCLLKSLGVGMRARTRLCSWPLSRS